MKSFKTTISAGLAALALCACGPRTVIDCTIAQAPGSRVTVRQLNVNTYNVLDTVTADASGHFSYKVDVADGQPEFIYLFRGDTRLAGLLLERGETAVVSADTLGNYEVSGSEGSALLKEADGRFAAFARRMASLTDPAEINRTYIDYYRECVKFVMEHPASLVTIPVLYQNLGPEAPVFSQYTDAIHFRNAADTLGKLYPESVYVKALAKEASRREGVLGVDTYIKNAGTLGYPDLNMPDVNGSKVAISSLDSKVILVHFWNAAEPAHNIFNTERLLPLYNEFHSRGLEIYSVCLDVDKAEWATTVKGQKLPWINVNDGLGGTSPSIWQYNVQQLPATFIIASGQISLSGVSDIDGLRAEVRRLLSR